MRIYSSSHLCSYHFSSICSQSILEFSQLQNALLEHHYDDVSIALLLLTLLSEHKSVSHKIEDL